ncbi:MAG: ABC transporter ATP-binding protein [Clostridiales bacterium]|nr:ABC transporter ATP-binding protein [Clostridiales bacterium]
MDVFLGVSREIIQLIITILPSVVIWLCMNRSYGAAITAIAVMVIALTLLKTLVEYIQRDLSDESLHATNSLYYYLNGKNARLDLSDAEDGSMIDEYYNVFDNIYNFSDVHYSIFCVLLSKLLSFAIMSAFIIAVDLRLYAIVLLQNLIVLIINAKKDKLDHEFDEEMSKNTKRVKYLSELTDDFEAGRDLRIYNGNAMVSDKYSNELLNSRKIEMRKQRCDFLIELAISLLGLGELFLIYLFAINKYAAGGLLLASFILYVSASKQIASSISEIVWVAGVLHTASIYYDDFDKYLKIEEKMRNTGADKPVEGESEPFIEFRNVSFKYPNQTDYAIKDFSCKIDYGEHIAIVGDNGAGKSTFVKLLLRLYDPTDGAIYYKGKNIKEYDYDSYQEIFAPVFQDYVLNAFSIRENLIFDYTEREGLIKGALEKTGMYDKITEIGLDRTYSRRFSEDGVELSGGEEQRLVISRAYCKNSNVVVLDEPTAAIDPLSERKLFQDVFDGIGNTTSIMISHRMSCSKFSSRIFVMERGKLAENGTHSELLNLGGLYASMYRRQAEYYS